MINTSALTVSAQCERPYGSGCTAGDPSMPCAHVCTRDRGHADGCGGCACGS